MPEFNTIPANSQLNKCYNSVTEKIVQLSFISRVKSRMLNLASLNDVAI
jgi:hypothetical protein